MRRRSRQAPGGGATDHVPNATGQIARPCRACEHPAVMRELVGRVLIVAVVSLAGTVRAVEPTPAPPTSLDEIPSAKPEDVARLLRKVRQHHGDDAVVVQTHLLLNAMQKGSVLATGVRVEHVEEALGRRWLRVILETGFVFDDSTRDRMERAQIRWAAIMEPTLARLEDGLQVNKADGLLVLMQSHHRPYRSADELRAHIDEPGTSEETRFYVSSANVDDVVRGKRTLRALLADIHTEIDGAATAVAPPGDDLALTPGPE